ncbi:MAG TPA: glycosyltransferase family 39 protein [Aggregatilineales bacterium]|nr:glycosyltransferase family 39 protein [Aggregatilineales bacterium]
MKLEQRSHLALVVLILIIGFVLRAVDTGAAPLQVDEAWVAYLSFSEGYLGERPEMGMKTSTGIDHSPFLHDVLSLSFAVSPDPRIARLYEAELHLIGMALLYLLVRRYWSAQAGLAALILYIAVPRGVLAGRYLWNPYLVAPFLIGYFLTGFLILDGRRFARWLHPALFVAAVQCHPAVVVMVPLTLAFYGLDLRKPCRWAKVRDHLIGIGVGAALVVPWVVGIIHQNQVAQVVPRLRQSSGFAYIFDAIVNYQHIADFGALGIPKADFTPLSGLPLTLAAGIGLATVLIGLALIGRTIVQRGRFREAALAVGYLIMPVLLLVLPTRAFDAYFIPLIPLAAAMQAILLFGDRPQRTRWRWGLVIAICAFQGAIDVNWLVQVHDFRHFTRASSLSLNAMVDLRNQAERSGYESIYLVDGADRGDFVQAMEWLTIATRGPARVFWLTPNTLPVPGNGATYIGYADATFIPELYRDPQPRLIAGNLYRVVDLPPGSGFTPTCRPAGPARLSNGVTILGYYTPGDEVPTPGAPWWIYLLWRGEPNRPQQAYQVFTHLMDSGDVRHAQQDLPVPGTDLWRKDDLFVTRVELTPDNQTSGPLLLRVGMYTLADMKNTRVLDAAGNLTGQWVTIPVCGASADF